MRGLRRQRLQEVGEEILWQAVARLMGLGERRSAESGLVFCLRSWLLNQLPRDGDVLLSYCSQVVPAGLEVGHGVLAPELQCRDVVRLCSLLFSCCKEQDLCYSPDELSSDQTTHKNNLCICIMKHEKCAIYFKKAKNTTIVPLHIKP